MVDRGDDDTVCQVRGVPPRHALAPLLLDQRHDARPARAAARDLDRETAHLKAVRTRELVEIGELLDLAVLALDTGSMRRPDDGGVARLRERLPDRPERPVEAPGVGADHLDALVAEPERRLAAETAAALEVGGGAPELVRPGVEHHDVERL